MSSFYILEGAGVLRMSQSNIVDTCMVALLKNRSHQFSKAVHYEMQ